MIYLLYIVLYLIIGYVIVIYAEDGYWNKIVVEPSLRDWKHFFFTIILYVFCPIYLLMNLYDKWRWK